MATLTFLSKQNDRKVPLTVRLRYADGSTPDISALSATDFKIHVRDSNGTVSTFTDAVIDDVADARIHWPLDATLAAVVEDYDVEVEINWPGPLTDTFPVCDELVWSVIAEIG